MSWVGWVIAVGGPLLGIGAVMALVVAHEHARWLRRLPVKLPTTPAVVRRAHTVLLDDYLSDERGATAAVRRRGHARLLFQMERANTAVLEEFLEERAEAQTAAAVPVEPRRPAPRAVRRPVIEERAARPTRLVPLAPEIAIG